MTPGPAPSLADRLRARIRADGPLPFSEYMRDALYAEDGFFSTHGRAGRRGDFITSPEVGPLFGALVARALDGWWDELGRPEGFTIVELGAGTGTLGRTVHAASPACLAAGRYHLVEQSALLRAEHPSDPVFVSASQGPAESFTGVVIANEFLDNQPFDLIRFDGHGWQEVLVDVDEGGAFVERLGEAVAPPGAIEAARPGAEVPVQTEAAGALSALLRSVANGRVVIVDYTASTAELAERPRSDWLRTYRQHERGGDPLEQPGRQDITVDVAVDQLPAPDRRLTQAEFLRSLGIDELVDEGRRVWTERAALGDLEALRARSRVAEAEALLDPDGLGGFEVLEWFVNGP